jgi:hypothetical protein
MTFFRSSVPPSIPRHTSPLELAQLRYPIGIVRLDAEAMQRLATRYDG